MHVADPRFMTYANKTSWFIDAWHKPSLEYIALVFGVEDFGVIENITSVMIPLMAEVILSIKTMLMKRRTCKKGMNSDFDT